ncbi:MAG: DUF6468 domain-containing protein [Pseudomonadota bacterium]
MGAVMGVLADFLLLAAALGAGGYCFALSRRLTRLTSMDKGLGSAIAVLSAQVDDLTKALEDARSNSEATVERLAALVVEAEALTGDIEEMLAACHDLAPTPAPPVEEAPPPTFGSRRSAATAAPVFQRRKVRAEAAE